MTAPSLRTVEKHGRGKSEQGKTQTGKPREILRRKRIVGEMAGADGTSSKMG